MTVLTHGVIKMLLINLSLQNRMEVQSYKNGWWKNNNTGKKCKYKGASVKWTTTFCPIWTLALYYLGFLFTLGLRGGNCPPPISKFKPKTLEI